MPLLGGHRLTEMKERERLASAAYNKKRDEFLDDIICKPLLERFLRILERKKSASR